MAHESPPLDDHDLVHRLGDLREHVARDQDRAALRGESAQEVAQPADPLRIETVRGLVEDQHLGIAEQPGGQPEPLAHSERVALHAPSGRGGELDELEDLVDAFSGNPGGGGEHAQVVAPRPSGMRVERLQDRADLADRAVEVDAYA